MGHILAYMITAQTRREHRARWYVYGGGYGEPLVRMRHQATMRGHWPGYDVECSCGWKTRTGGAGRTHVEDLLWDHRFAAQCETQREDEKR